MLSQVFPDVTVAVTFVELAGNVLIVRFCAAGAVVPSVNANAIDGGPVSDKEGPKTVNVIGIVVAATPLVP
jgi:hypothetical protein